LCERKLFACYIDGSRTFFAFNDLESDFVARLQFLKCNVLQILGVEEKILRLAFASDESKSSVRKGFDSTVHSVVCLFLPRNSTYFTLPATYSAQYSIEGKLRQAGGCRMAKKCYDTLYAYTQPKI